MKFNSNYISLIVAVSFSLACLGNGFATAQKWNCSLMATNDGNKLKSQNLVQPRIKMEVNISEMLERAMPSIVTIAVTSFRDNKTAFWGIRSSLPPHEAFVQTRTLHGGPSFGSGFLVKSLDGTGKKSPIIVTNLHVVDLASDSTGSILVQDFYQRVYRARILNGDALYDFAILEFVDQPAKELSTLDFRDTGEEPLRIGEKVFAIGNPIGKYPFSVSDGIVSGLNRVFGGFTGKFGYLQTTATVIDGSSGSPLLDQRGRVVGMMSKVACTDELPWISHLNFALEARVCQRLRNQIIKDGNVTRAWLGLEFQALGSRGQRENPFLSLHAIPKLVSVHRGAPERSELDAMIGKHLIIVDEIKIRNLEEALEAFEDVRPGVNTTLIFTDGKNNDTLTITPDTLRRSHLVDLANRLTVIDQALSGEFWEETPIRIAVLPGRVYHEDSGKAKLHFAVLAAGRHTARSQGSFMHEVVLPHHLGAVIRQYSMTGRIDLIIMLEGASADEEDMNILSVNFDGSPLTEPGQPTLFY